MSDIAIDTIKEGINHITEGEAWSVLYALQSKFGWAGTMFCRGDAETAWESATDKNMSDKDWDAVRSNKTWSRVIEERCCEEGWEIVHIAIDEVIGGIRYGAE